MGQLRQALSVRGSGWVQNMRFIFEGAHKEQPVGRIVSPEVSSCSRATTAVLRPTIRPNIITFSYCAVVLCIDEHIIKII